MEPGARHYTHARTEPGSCHLSHGPSASGKSSVKRPEWTRSRRPATRAIRRCAAPASLKSGSDKRTIPIHGGCCTNPRRRVLVIGTPNGLTEQIAGPSLNVILPSSEQSLARRRWSFLQRPEFVQQPPCNSGAPAVIAVPAAAPPFVHATERRRVQATDARPGVRRGRLLGAGGDARTAREAAASRP